MEPDTFAASAPEVQGRPDTSLHGAAWPDMLTNLQVAYAELTRTQRENEHQVAEINETRELFERVIESMSEALFLMDATGRVIRVNRAAGALLERAEADLLGQSFAAACGTTDIPATPWQLLACAPSGTLPNMDLELCTHTGRVVPVSFSCGLVRDRRGKITGVLVIAHDITARKRSEAERQELNRQLVEVSRLAGMADVAASVLHNVGNVLNSVNVAASLVASTLRKSPLGDIGRIATMLHEHTDALGDYLTHDPKGRQIPGYLTTLADYLTQEQATLLKELEALSSKIDHIRQIIDRQQDMARVGGGREPVWPGELMEEALEMNLAALQRHQIEVVREYAEVPQIIVDKHQVLQILVNLISNARDAMQAWHGRQHRLTLRTGLAEDREGRVRLQVQDTGIGITPEHLPRIFTQGFTTKKDGHGLGLHSSALAARLLDGSLSVHSAGEGQGATFTLDVPARPREEHR